MENRHTPHGRMICEYLLTNTRIIHMIFDVCVVYCFVVYSLSISTAVRLYGVFLVAVCVVTTVPVTFIVKFYPRCSGMLSVGVFASCLGQCVPPHITDRYTYSMFTNTVWLWGFQLQIITSNLHLQLFRAVIGS